MIFIIILQELRINSHKVASLWKVSIKCPHVVLFFASSHLSSNILQVELPVHLLSIEPLFCNIIQEGQDLLLHLLDVLLVLVI